MTSDHYRGLFEEELRIREYPRNKCNMSEEDKQKLRGQKKFDTLVFLKENYSGG